MSDDQLHVVFGAGQVGRALTGRLAELGLAVRAVSRNRPSELRRWRRLAGSRRERPRGCRGGGRGRLGHLPVPERAIHRLAGAFPPLQRGVLSAAERTRRAAGEPGEPLRLRPDRGPGDDRGSPARGHHRQGQNPGRDDPGVAGRLGRRSCADRDRARLRLLRRRVTTGTTLGERVFANASPANARTSSATPTSPHLQLCPGHRHRPGDARNRRARDRRGVAPTGTETVTTRSSSSSWPTMSGTRSASEPARSSPSAPRPVQPADPRDWSRCPTSSTQPFVLDTTKYQSTFGSAGTPLATAITATVDWYRSQNGSPDPRQRKDLSHDPHRYRDRCSSGSSPTRPPASRSRSPPPRHRDGAEDVVRFNWRSMPGGAITEHLHPAPGGALHDHRWRSAFHRQRRAPRRRPWRDARCAHRRASLRVEPRIRRDRRRGRAPSSAAHQRDVRGLRRPRL